MTSSISNFIANFRGGARPNRFRVSITWPGAVGAPNVRDEIVVIGAGMPASVLGTVLAPFRGRQIPLPGDRVFEDWTITVVNDISFSHRNAFERWSNLILAHEGNVQGTQNYKDLLATIDISHLDRNDNVLKTIKLQNAYPTNIAQIDLSYEDNDLLERYTVTFAYSHWTGPGTN